MCGTVPCNFFFFRCKLHVVDGLFHYAARTYVHTYAYVYIHTDISQRADFFALPAEPYVPSWPARPRETIKGFCSLFSYARARRKRLPFSRLSLRPRVRENNVVSAERHGGGE